MRVMGFAVAALPRAMSGQSRLDMGRPLDRPDPERSTYDLEWETQIASCQFSYQVMDTHTSPQPLGNGQSQRRSDRRAAAMPAFAVQNNQIRPCSKVSGAASQPGTA